MNNPRPNPFWCEPSFGRYREYIVCGEVLVWRGEIQLSAGELRKLPHHPLIDRALERNDQLGEVLHRLPAPVDELGLVATPAGACDIDFGVLAGKAHRKPLLPLAAIAALPGPACHRARNVIDQPVADLGEPFHR